MSENYEYVPAPATIADLPSICMESPSRSAAADSPPPARPSHGRHPERLTKQLAPPLGLPSLLDRRIMLPASGCHFLVQRAGGGGAPKGRGLMGFPPQMRQRLLTRFDQLLAEGKRILGTVEREDHPGVMTMSGNFVLDPPCTVFHLDEDSFHRWRANCSTLLCLVIPSGHTHRQFAMNVARYGPDLAFLRRSLATLAAIRDDLQAGLLDDVADQIQAEIASNYMGQAERLLVEGQPGRLDHVPAAVLAGAVLEKSLRDLCARQNPLVPIVNAKGDLLAMNALIDALRKAGMFNELKAKQLRAWADIRNKAAHGEFDAFARADVETMIQGVQQFLAENQ